VPNWQPNWQDVRWNWAAADYAAAQCDQRAENVDSCATVRRGVGDTASSDWRGSFHLRFEMQMLDSSRNSWSLAATLHDAAARIRRLSQMARDEQTHRERERERWRREKAEEDAAAARARAASASRARARAAAQAAASSTA